MSAVPGWYPDPQWMGRERYWDGQDWTDQSRPFEAKPRFAPLAKGKPAPSKPALAPVPPPSQAVEVVPPSPPEPRPGPGVITLLPVLVAEAAVVAPIAVGLHFRWPVLGAVVPFVVWWVIALLPFAAPSRIVHREPDAKERAQLDGPWRRLLERASLEADDYSLGITELDELNACAASGQVVMVTEQSARSLPSAQLEAVLAHELGHRLDWASARARLAWPSRLLWWTLQDLWTPVAPLWRRAVMRHRPIGFLLVFLLTALATAVTVILGASAAVSFTLHRLAHSLIGAESRADAFAVRLGLGAELLAAIESRIDAMADDDDLPLPLVHRAERLRRAIARTGDAPP